MTNKQKELLLQNFAMFLEGGFCFWILQKEVYTGLLEKGVVIPIYGLVVSLLIITILGSLFSGD